MTVSYLDIPTHVRGTVIIGGTEYHYERGSAKIGGALYLAAGPDTRDWSKIDAGALDYAVIARQEHDQPGFTGHDGPKITASCPICNSPTGTDEIAVKNARAAQVSIALQEHAAGQPHRLPDVAAACPTCHPKPVVTDTLGPVPDVETDEVRARREQREAEQRAAEEQARRDNELKRKLPSLEPGADPVDEAAALRAEVEALRAEREAHIAALEREADAAKAQDEAAFDAEIAELSASGHPTTPVDPAAMTDGFFTPEEPLEPLEEGQGRDPWTGKVVAITRNPGADAEAPYGRKGNGEPRRPSGGKRS